MKVSLSLNRFRIFVLAGIVFTLTLASSASATIEYSVSLDHPERHLFHVTMVIPDVKGEVNVHIAAWNALYQIKDFSSHVEQVSGSSSAGPAAIEKQDKQTWRIQGSGNIRVSYATYWDEPGPFASQLNSEHAFLNPAMILFYVAERLDEKVSLHLVLPSPSWRAANSLSSRREEAGGTAAVTFDAANFEALADAPTEAGRFDQFELEGVTPGISVVLHGDPGNKKHLEEDLRKICKYQVKMMGGAPYEHFTFILHLGRGYGGGGMEHENSTAIGIFSVEYLPNLAAHEFFHLWNVKRIKPATLDPVDYSKEQYTRALWFAEGVTNTYASYTLVRTGIWSKERFYSDLSEQITEIEGRPANRWQSAEESSLDAWLEKYPLYNQAENSISYYTKGQILGNLLDTVIRDRTDNTKSLDDVLRAMNSDFAQKGRPYRDSLDIRLAAEKVAGSSFESFFSKYVSGTDPFPYQQVLAMAGLSLKTTERRRPSLGFSLEREQGQVTIGAVEPGGPAAEAGLHNGDVILSWNGAESPRKIERWLVDQHPGDTLKLKIRRDDKELNIETRIGEITETLYSVGEDSRASEKARRIREGLLRGETSAVSASLR